MSGNHYDELETRTPEEREGALFAALPAQVAHARENAPAYASLFADVEPEAIYNRKSLATLPVTRKSDLIDRQRENPPFGGFTAVPVGNLARVFVSPGPIFEPEARRPDFWRMARALYAAGFRAGHKVHNSFAYHFTPAGAMLESGARALGCAVFPGGVGQTEQQIEAIEKLRPDGYTGTPSFLKILLEKARADGKNVSSVRRALVSGEALPPRLRGELEALGVGVLQCYGTADLGLIAYESDAAQGMILDETIILEILRPGTGDPLPAGEVGEVTITTLNPDYPLIRFATGDLSRVIEGRSPCGRTNVRIQGWMGRADQTTKIRGMFVHPHQVAAVVRRHPEVGAARLVVDSDNSADVMTLHCEVRAPADEGLAGRIVDSIRDVCKLRGEVSLVEPASLANDGKVIEDRRTYD